MTGKFLEFVNLFLVIFILNCVEHCRILFLNNTKVPFRQVAFKMTSRVLQTKYKPDYNLKFW